MREYSFVSIPVARHRDGTHLTRDYREVILERAEDGWKFVQAIPFEDHSEPRIDLVFTRKGESQ